MYQKLKENLEKSYSPYSNYRVSACVITESGNEYFGVNVENSSFGGTVCAERVAILKAVSQGENSFKELHIMGDSLAMPCFICRQTMIEFFDKNTKIFIYNDKDVKEYSLLELCPLPFEGDNI